MFRRKILYFGKLRQGGHPDGVVERARNPDTVARDITVGDIRGLSEFFRMTTVAGGWRGRTRRSSGSHEPERRQCLARHSRGAAGAQRGIRPWSHMRPGVFSRRFDRVATLFR